MTNFPRAFCVTLKDTPLRTKHFIDSCNKIGLKVELFYGVWGDHIKLTPRLPNEIECPGKNIYMTDGAVGCYLSHFILWNVLLYQPENEFLIFEDDAIFVDDFSEKFKSYSSRLPSNWDIVFVGWVPYGNNTRVMKVDENISIRHPSATHAYMIKKSALQLAIDVIQPCGSPIDLIMVRKLLPQLKYYVFDPSIVTQKSYANSNDSIWNSLVYDWNNDLYGIKNKFIKNTSLGEGWNDVEQNDTEMWRWSKDNFEIKIPKNIESITLECSTPVENSVEIIIGESKMNFPLCIGNNSFNVPTKEQTILHGKLLKQFIPSKVDSKSNDDRILGICLKKLIINTGTTKLELGVREISAGEIMPISFKL